MTYTYSEPDQHHSDKTRGTWTKQTRLKTQKWKITNPIKSGFRQIWDIGPNIGTLFSMCEAVQSHDERHHVYALHIPETV